MKQKTPSKCKKCEYLKREDNCDKYNSVCISAIENCIQIINPPKPWTPPEFMKSYKGNKK